MGASDRSPRAAAAPARRTPASPARNRRSAHRRPAPAAGAAGRYSNNPRRRRPGRAPLQDKPAANNPRLKRISDNSSVTVSNQSRPKRTSASACRDRRANHQTASGNSRLQGNRSRARRTVEPPGMRGQGLVTTETALDVVIPNEREIRRAFALRPRCTTAGPAAGSMGCPSAGRVRHRGPGQAALAEPLD